MIKRLLILFAFQLLLVTCSFAQVNQININRIEMMPNEPAPFNLRDWSEVAMKYDSFIYDLNKTGQYLPTISLRLSGVNYPGEPTFGLHTYVGTNNPSGGEAINILPSLVGATLVGIDKTNQFGRNWVRMSRDFFNKSNGELIYSNNPGARSGNDWWYDMMPNIYFCQLYDLYPNLGTEADFQFISIAGQFSKAVRAMGGSDTPWEPAFMNYRAWSFSDMEPNATGVKEPEAAGAYAWVLYHVWKQTGNEEYLKAAEWSMEFLSDWTSNPSYEMQLPYGIYAAAKMNAELNTDYDIEKMTNWAFDRGALRGWGSVVGEWGGFDVNGLIGEANDGGNDYAFQMNGLHQAAALAPMVRYDKRFARAIGKWILNLANANRLFYPGFLSDNLQDASGWSNEYDPDQVVGYEALREQWQGNSPFSTGDALRGGWAATNLALYGTSSIGYLGAVLEKTNDPKILKIDLLKTDFYNENAYPTYLLFNPYASAKRVGVEVGNTPVDIYEALSENFISDNVTGTVQIIIPADEAIIITLVPAGGMVSYEKNRMLLDGVAVDYMQTAETFQYKPRIQSLAAAEIEVASGDSTEVFVKAADKDSDNLTYDWSATGGTISGNGTAIKWTASVEFGDYEITVKVTDESGNTANKTIALNSVAEINEAPEILEIIKEFPSVMPNETLELQAVATDANDDLLTYDWSSTGGSISGSGEKINWTAPGAQGSYEITVKVSDPAGLSATASTSVLVRNFDPTQGNLIAWYPFSGNGLDISGNDLHGQISGGLLVNDFFGNPQSALRTDGVNDRMTTDNDPKLNFEEAITVSALFRATQTADREVFLVSHGSWQNRWKVSIIPDQKIRWTVNTANSIRDLDSEIEIEKDSVYHVAATYDGSWMTLYVNGELQTSRAATGKIRKTSLPLLVAQMLPDNSDYNFKGILDEVKIFDYALTPQAVAELYDGTISTTSFLKNQYSKLTVSPNPVTDFLNVELLKTGFENGTVSIFDRHGGLLSEQRAVASNAMILNVENLKAGMYVLVYKNDKNIVVTSFFKS